MKSYFLSWAISLTIPSSSSGAGEFIGKTLHQMEKEMIIQTLEEVDNNKTKCAEILGISIRTLRNKLTEYGAKSK